MNLLEKMRIIKRGTADNAVVAALQFVHVYEGRIQSTDGKIVIDAQCDELKGMTFSVPGTKFVKAIEACNGNPKKIELTDTNLQIQDGKFKVKLPLYDGTYPKREFAFKHEDMVKVIAPLHPLLRRLSPFIGEDASRPWCCGVLFRDGMVTATNNTSIVTGSYVFDKPVPAFNLPMFAITEMLTFGREPLACFVDEVSATFDYGDFMFKTQLLPSDWPDTSKLLGAPSDKLKPVPDALLEAVDKITAFCPDSDFQCIVFDTDKISTAEGTTFAELAGFELSQGRYRAVVLRTVLNEASHVDFSAYPNPIPFTTDAGLRGVFVGVRA